MDNLKKQKIFRVSCLRALTISLVLSLGGGFYVPQAKAEKTLSTPALQGLAAEFLKRIGSGFEQADSRPENMRNILSVGTNTPTSTIPDGEELVMGILASDKKIPLNNDILTIKQPYGLDILLSDFFSSIDFAIRVDSDSGTAEGWFIKQDQSFALDLNNKTVKIINQEYELAEGDVFVLDNEIYAKSTAIENWFNLKFVYDYSELRVLVFSEQPLPAVERYNRRAREFSQTRSIGDPSLPFDETNYRGFDVPALDVNLRTSYFKNESSDAQTSGNWSVLGAGDFAYLNTKTFLAGDEDNIISEGRVTFERESESNDLLGPLNARRVAFGDVYTPRLNISGGSNQEQGIVVSNRPEDVLANRNSTIFRGDAQPGWDVELYRGDRILDFQTVNTNGQYEFLDVPLFSGPNNFTILLLGPQGEVQEIQESVPVNASTLASGNNFYEVSISRNNEVTYRRNKFDQPQDGSPHFVGRYSMGLGDNAAITTGLQSRDEGDTRRNYLEAGFSTSINETFLDLNTSYETSDQSFGAEVLARRNFGAHSLRSSVFASTDDFQPGPTNELSPSVFETDINLDGPLPPVAGMRLNYGIFNDFTKRADSSFDFDLGGSVSARYKNYVFNNNLNYERQRNNLGIKDDFLRYVFNARGVYKGGFLRFRGNYDIVPDAKLRQLFTSYNYPFSNKLDGLFEVQHDLDPSLTEFVASLNIKNDDVTITPRFSYDTDSTLFASLNMRFGVGYDPIKREASIFNQRLSNTGGVSARVFVDSNGNGILDDNEELVEGAQLEAVQVRKSGISDDQGVAFIPNLPRGRVTDVKIDQSSLLDPYWIPNFDGISMRPRPGVVKKLDFPLVVSGEIDGTIYFINENGTETPARQFKVHLVAPWGEVVKTTATAYDGFYILGEVPPGIYYLVADYKDALQTGYTTPPPQRVELKPDGTTIFGNDIKLSKGATVPYSFTSDITPTSRKNRKVLQETGSNHAGVRLGPYKSKLAATLSALKFKKNAVSRRVKMTDPLEGLTRDPENKLFWISTDYMSNDVATANDICFDLQENKISCEVNIHTDAYIQTESVNDDG